MTESRIPNRGIEVLRRELFMLLFGLLLLVIFVSQTGHALEWW